MTDARTRLVFLRHGRASNAEGRCIGHTDIPLSRQGEAAIRELCVRAPSIIVGRVRVTASDLSRSLDSAAVVAAALDVEVTIDRRLREMHFGEWDGRLWADIERDDGDRLRAWTDRWISASPPGGESVSDVERRAADWIGSELVLAADGDQTIFVVSHAGWIRVAVNLLLARPLTHLFDTPIEHARATIIDLYSSRVHLVAENVEEFPSFLVYEGRSDD